jgi:hypothetical protein
MQVNKRKKEKIMEKYNGWTSRETWLVNLHFGEMIQEDTKEFIENNQERPSTYVISEMLKDQLEDLFLEEIEGLSMFLQDFIDLSLINWYELAENYESECE